MSRYFCWDDRDHERQAVQDAQRGRRDVGMYERYSLDPCKEAYTEAYDRERRSIERREEEIEQERQDEQRLRRAAEMRSIEEAQYAMQQYEEQYPQEPEQPQEQEQEQP